MTVSFYTPINTNAKCLYSILHSPVLHDDSNNNVFVLYAQACGSCSDAENFSGPLWKKCGMWQMWIIVLSNRSKATTMPC